MFFPILGSRLSPCAGATRPTEERRWVTGWESVPAIIGLCRWGPWAFESPCVPDPALLLSSVHSGGAWSALETPQW